MQLQKINVLQFHSNSLTENVGSCRKSACRNMLRWFVQAGLARLRQRCCRCSLRHLLRTWPVARRHRRANAQILIRAVTWLAICCVLGRQDQRTRESSAGTIWKARQIARRWWHCWLNNRYTAKKNVVKQRESQGGVGPFVEFRLLLSASKVLLSRVADRIFAKTSAVVSFMVNN